MTRFTIPVVSLLAALSLGCEGPVGPAGRDGEDGPPGRDGRDAVLPDGGPPPDSGPPPVDAGPVPIEPEGLVGRVMDTAGSPLEGGRVVLVPSADVAALAATSIDPNLAPAAAAASAVDEPIEDILDTATDLVSASIDASGIYRFTSLPDEDVFVVVVPATDDTEHLPGGEEARFSQAAASLRGARLDLRVSTRPSESAFYVGSSACVTCHGTHRAYGTAHFNGLSRPGAPSYQQDTSRWPDFNAALRRFEDGVTLYFHDCTPGRDPECLVSESATGTVAFQAALSRNTSVPLGALGAYQVTLSNPDGTSEATYPVELTYGGALFRQQFIVPITKANGVERHLLPFQFNHAGTATDPNPLAQRWRDVGSSDWFAGGALTEPGSGASFDNQCAGCHFTGFRLRGDVTDGFRASAVPSPFGVIDYDGDGRVEQISLGCESCHGPGSEHLEAGGHGVAIVSPHLLTPERANVICGTCHSRPQGRGGAASQAPLSEDEEMPRPGIRRSELITNHYGRSEVRPGNLDLFPSGDPRQHRLQYVDHVRSAMYRNGSILMTCVDCHDVHGNPAQPHDLRRAPDDNATCTSCHSGAEFTTPLTHVNAMTAEGVHVGLDLVCTTCHMPRTATGGAQTPALLDNLFPSTPPGLMPRQHYSGDIATHRYRPSLFDVANQQPATVTNACAFCHRSFIPNL